eukprot:1803018-Prymnesium_polylepis.1
MRPRSVPSGAATWSQQLSSSACTSSGSRYRFSLRSTCSSTIAEHHKRSHSGRSASLSPENEMTILRGFFPIAQKISMPLGASRSAAIRMAS